MIVRSQMTFSPDFGAYSRVAKRILGAAHEAGAGFWHRTFLPLHFRLGAARKYGYRSRSRKYQFSRAKRGKPALVNIGTTRDRATAEIRVKPYPTRAILTLYTPSWIPQRPRKPNRPDMAAEIFRVRSDEQKQIETTEQETAERMLRDLNETRTVRIG